MGPRVLEGVLGEMGRVGLGAGTNAECGMRDSKKARSSSADAGEARARVSRERTRRRTGRVRCGVGGVFRGRGVLGRQRRGG